MILLINTFSKRLDLTDANVMTASKATENIAETSMNVSETTNVPKMLFARTPSAHTIASAEEDTRKDLTIFFDVSCFGNELYGLGRNVQ